ncbi:MAG TPA: DNA (cytosine-5-)-methyltransferase [Bacteroidales bacterium]|nr:DNA (cytosine-5-)-methyltransferase [Bacteroidales bacterium]HPS15637.1 DNA (cytosine-5-)-methyltransferase [Bacteroidales bacterium]
MINNSKNTNTNFAVVDLFCGVGGLTQGFVKAKFNVIAGIDFDVSCKYAYEKNNLTPFLHIDLTKYSPYEIAKLFPEGSIKILAGCAPCQAFSTYQQGNKKNDKWKLLYSFGKIIEAIQPDIVSMENVPNLMKYNNGVVFEDFITVLKANDYFVSYQVVDAKDYGVPQRRKRLILLASKFGKIELIRKTHIGKKVKTVKKAIGHLPKIKAGEFYHKDKLHRARELSDLNLKRIRATSQGGSWKEWDDKLVLDCHKKETGKSYGSVYGRMNWDDVSPTLTTQCTGYGNGRFGHPTQDRAISLREAAILQSFPKKYQFINPKEDFYPSIIEKHIGNAVPPRLGYVIAKSINEHIQQHHEN